MRRLAILVAGLLTALAGSVHAARGMTAQGLAESMDLNQGSWGQIDGPRPGQPGPVRQARPVEPAAESLRPQTLKAHQRGRIFEFWLPGRQNDPDRRPDADEQQKPD